MVSRRFPIVFPKKKSLIHYELLPPDKTINSDLYCRQLIRLEQEVEKKRPELIKRKKRQPDGIRKHEYALGSIPTSYTDTQTVDCQSGGYESAIRRTKLSRCEVKARKRLNGMKLERGGEERRVGEHCNCA
ncbi:hypothetical protein EVAR_49824_1 [Eumeta japonica]|uniref:Uncharacterized protein n=1 Tax=Eumeta variegata TaxID=151549 RepID=A0A4C1XP24_EUMVA|nr:hypothetical protein EVAR_49824_1 [Eumeta japonica]